MITIKGYILKPEQQLMMIPSDSILSIGSLDDNIIIYALVDSSDNEGRPYQFKMFYTDEEIGTELIDFTFLGTTKLYGKNKNIHVFYKSLFSKDL